jgi:hypothetical protein
MTNSHERGDTSMLEDLKDHLRQEHGIHEAPEDVATTEGDPSAGASYGPGLPSEQLEALHDQHHTENPELLRHSHDDGGTDQ